MSLFTELPADIQRAVAVGLASLVVALLGYVADRLRRVHADTKAARHEVQNEHTTNLRDDLDKVMTGLDRVLEGQVQHSDALTRHGSEISGVRRDLRVEREERLALSSRVDHNLINQTKEIAWQE